MQVIFNTGVWNGSLHQNNPELESLARQLPEVVMGARADSTVNAYSGAFNRWRDWATKYDKSVIPADPLDVSLYLVHLSRSSQSPAPIDKAVAGLSWAHKLAGVPDPTLSTIVTFTHDGFKRRLSKPVTKKEPVTPEIIKGLISSYILPKGFNPLNLMNIRTVTMCVIAYAGFLRYDELVNIRLKHLTFTEYGLRIFIPSSKTDIYRGGRNVVISKLDSQSCPVSILKSYMSLIQVQPDSLIFRSLTKFKDGYKLREDNQPMSYTRVREIILEALKPLVEDISLFGVHSLRSGGATAAANAGVNDRLFKRHGRWKTEVAKDGYVKDSEESLLAVSKSLGL